MDAKRPCCSPLTCCWMPVECVSFVFAIINAIICSLWTLASVSYVFLLIGEMSCRQGHQHDLEETVVTSVIIFNFIGSVVALAFAVLLCIGLSKNKPRFVLAYLVYGLVSLTLSVLGALGTFGRLLSISKSKEIAATVTLAMFVSLAGCAIYMGILALVYQSYKVVSGRAPVTEHRRFQDTSA